MSFSVGDIAGAKPNGGLADLYALLEAQEKSSEMSTEQYLQITLGNLDRFDKNLMAAEIKAVLSDALSSLRNSGNMVRESGK